MAKMMLQNFSGEIPRKDPAYLGDSNAEEASNLKLTGGTLRPLRTNQQVSTLPLSGWSLYGRGSKWYAYTARASFVPGPVAANRLYASRNDGSGAVIAAPAGAQDGELPLHFPRANKAPAFTVSGAVDDDLAEIVKYAYTLVSILGEETAPSGLTVGIKFNQGRTVVLSGLPTTMMVNNRNILAKRIYRSQTSASGITDLYYIGEVGPSTATFTDVWGANDIQEPCPTKHFEPAPQNLRGLTGMPNGIIAGYVGRELMFCEPYQPHAWPLAYRLYLDHDIVGMVSCGTSLIVLTRGCPYIVQGLHPDSMAAGKVETILPCVSDLSIVDLGTSAIYASNDGLVQISEGGAQLITQDLWSKDEWDALGPGDIRAGRFGQDYIFSFPAESGGRQGYIVSPSNGQAMLTRFNLWTRLFWNDPTTNDLYYLAPDGVSVNRFDAPGAAPMTFIWKSKTFRFVEPVNFSAIIIEAAEYSEPAQRADMHVLADDRYVLSLNNVTAQNVAGEPQHIVVQIPAANVPAESSDRIVVRIGAAATESFRIRIWGDGKLIHTIERGMNRVQRLPHGSYRKWQIEISGTAEIMRLVAAQSPGECWS